MKLITQNKSDALTVLEEIIKDTNSSWYHPKGKVGGGSGPGFFDFGRMKFINRNLNYFYLENMISLALKNNYDYNQNFKKTLNICNQLRDIVNEKGPFGRMCVWKLPPKGYLLPHLDNLEYHRQIRRYIFCVGTQEKNKVLIKINNENIEVTQGLIFQFNPSYEIHEFVNYTNENWYFLGFDYWDLDKLKKISEKTHVTIDTNIKYDNGFGGFKSLCKFMSKE